MLARSTAMVDEPPVTGKRIGAVGDKPRLAACDVVVPGSSVVVGASASTPTFTVVVVEAGTVVVVEAGTVVVVEAGTVVVVEAGTVVVVEAGTVVVVEAGGGGGQPSSPSSLLSPVSSFEWLAETPESWMLSESSLLSQGPHEWPSSLDSPPSLELCTSPESQLVSTGLQWLFKIAMWAASQFNPR